MSTSAINPLSSATLITVRNPFDVADQERELLPLSPDVKLGDLITVPEQHAVSVNGRLFEHDDWREYRVIDGDYVVLCPIPAGGGGGKNILRVVALIAISVAAPYAAAGILGTSVGALGVAGNMLAAGIAVSGSILVNSLIPIEQSIPRSESLEQDSPSYGIDGPKNSEREGIPVPVVYGTYRVGGNLVNIHTENLTDEGTQNLAMLFALSEGPVTAVDLETVEINGQPWQNFNDVRLKSRLGSKDQSIIPWFDDSVVPFNVGVTLSTDWHTYTMQTVADKVRIDFVCPNGFRRISDDGKSLPIRRRIIVEYRKSGTSDPWVQAEAGEFSVTGTMDVAFINENGFEKSYPLSSLPPQYTVSNRKVYITETYDRRYTYDPGGKDGSYANIPPGYSNDPKDGGGNGWRAHYDNSKDGTPTFTRLVQVGVVQTTEYLSYDTTLYGKKSSPLRKSFAWALPEPGVYDIRVKRETDESTDSQIIDKIVWSDLNEIVVSEVQYRYTALLGVQIRLTDQLNSRPKVTVEVAGRPVRVPQDWYEVGNPLVERHSSNPAWIALDALTNNRYGPGYGDHRINWADWMRWGAYCDEKGLEFNGIFDTSGNFWESLMHVFRCGRAKIVPQGTKFGVAIEQTDFPTMMFNVSNIKKSSLTINWLPMSERTNEIRATYYDRDNGYKATVLKVVSPDLQQGATPRVADLNLIGVTSAEQARKEAQLLLNMNRFIQQTVTFEAPVEALACRVGSLILLQHDIPQWGEGGRTKAGSTDTVIQLDRPVTMEVGQNYTLMLNYDNLLVSTGVLGEKINARNFYISTDYGREGIHALIVNGEEYEVQAVYLAGDGVRRILTLSEDCPAQQGDSYELYRLDALEERSVVTVPGESTQVTLAEPMPAAPGAYVKWLFGKLEGSQKQFRVLSIEGEGIDTRRLTCVEYYDAIYADSGAVAEPPNFSALPMGQHVTNLTAVQERRVVGTVSEPIVRLEWDKFDNYRGANVYARLDNGNWQTVAQLRNGETQVEYDDLILGVPTTFRVVAIDSVGSIASTETAPTVTVTPTAAGDILEPPTSITSAYAGDGIRLTWANPKAANYLRTEVWRNTANDVGSAVEVYAGADEQFTDHAVISGQTHYYWLRTINTDGEAGVFSAPTSPGALGQISNLRLKTAFIGDAATIVWDAQPGAAAYRVRVYTKGVLRRTETVTTNEYRYGIEDAIDDGDVDRNITFIVDAQAPDGSYATSSTLIATNPAPGLPTGLSVSAGFQIVTINFNPPEDPDYQDTVIWLSTTSGFTPDDANKVAVLKGGPITITDLSDDTDYYIRMTCRDVWGNGVVSAEYNARTLDLTASMGLSPWAFVTVADRQFIEDNLENDAIPSEKIVSLTASRITTGTLAATEKISVEGQVESVSGNLVVCMGPKLIDSKVALFSVMNGTTPLLRFNEDGTNEFRGSVTITGPSSGYASLTDKPTSLSDVNSSEAQRLNDSPVQSTEKTISTAGWYRIATNPGNRAAAKFTLRNIESSRHDSCVFTLGCSYNRGNDAGFALLSSVAYSTRTIQKIRLLTNSTYDDMYVEAYITNPAGLTNGFKLLIEDNYQTSGWTLADFTPGSIPAGYSAREWLIGPEYIADNTASNTANDTANVGGTPATTVLQNIQDALDAASGAITSFFQSTAPLANAEGDLWFDTDDGNKPYRWNGSVWQPAQDGGIQEALQAASDAEAKADGKVKTFFQTSTPTAEAIGDLWYSSSTKLMKRWDGSSWSTVSDVTDYADPRITNILSEGDVLTVARPGGATLSVNSPNQTGAIKITLPTSWSNTMMYFTVDVYNYATDKSFSLQIGGYNYTGGWRNVSARLIGSTASDNTVRFGHDGTNCCILIGDTNSDWDYPKVVVRDFQAGYSNYTESRWKDGWSIDIVTSLPSDIDQTISDALLDARAIKNQGALATKDNVSYGEITGTKPPANATYGADWATTLAGIPQRFTDAATPGLNLTPTHMGYYNNGWKTYIQNDGSFFFGDADAGQYIDFNPAIGVMQLGPKTNIGSNEDRTVTVGAGGDFSTINDALEALSRSVPAYKNGGFSAEIQLLSGYVLNEQIIVSQIDLSWITITSVDATVNWDTSGYATILGVTGERPAFAAIRGGNTPIISFNFDLTAGLQQSAFFAHDAGSAVHVRSLRVRYAEYGLYIMAGAIAYCDELVEFNDCDTGIFCGDNGQVVASYDVNTLNCQYGLHVVEGSTFRTAGKLDCTGCFNGVQGYDGSEIIIGDGLIADGKDDFTSGSRIKLQTSTMRVGAYAFASKCRSSSYGVILSQSTMACSTNLTARKNGSSDQSSDILLRSGSILSANNVIGGANIAKNQFTSSGIIWG